MTPGSIWRASKKPRILSKVHSTLQANSREEKAILEEIAVANSPRLKSYAGLGKGMPSHSSRPRGIIPPLVDPVGRIIERLTREILVSDSDDEEPQPQAAREIVVPDSDDKTSEPQEAETSTDKAESNGEGDNDDESEWGGVNINGEKGDTSEDEDEPNKGSNEEENDSDDSNWTTDDDDSEAGSSDMYSVEEESLGYVTSEDGSELGEVVNQVILEATLEGLNFEDNDLHSMDRAKKRNILQNTGLTELRPLQLMNLVDDIDIGIVVLNRLDQDLQRIGLQAASLLHMMELTGTLLSGSFLHPIMQWNTLIPNDLDMFVSLDAYNVVFSYLKKKGFTNCKKVYPSGQGHPGYGDNLQDISIIFEVRNRHAYKINVIVSKGQPILPILQFHSTIIMNYIAYHGLVCLYNITLH